MWVPKAVLDWFQISKNSYDDLRQELSAVRAEKDILKSQLAVSQNQFDWLRLRVNTLEIERAELIKKCYGIDAPVPAIVRQPKSEDVEPFLNSDLFNDVGDEKAKKLGLPVYS